MATSSRTKFILAEALADQSAAAEIAATLDAQSGQQALGTTDVPTFGGVKVGANQVLAARQTAVAMATFTFTANTPAAATGSKTVADGSAPTVAELIGLIVELKANIVALKNVFVAHGLTA